MKICDVIIIGGGPGGLTAAIYTSREGLNTFVLEKGLCGGIPTVTGIIENYPGFPDGIEGGKLAERFKKQTEKLGAQINEFTKVNGITPVGETVKVETNKGEYRAKVVIVASGSVPRKLGVPGEEEFIGRGVSYCAICDGPLYKDKSVVVIGGGNAAAQETLFLTKFARQVTLVHRRNELRADKILQGQLKDNKKIKLLLNHSILSVNGRDFVDSVSVRNHESRKVTKVETAGVFVYVGFLPQAEFIKSLVKLDSSGFIISNGKMETSCPGIYAVGDVRSKEVRQIAVACGEAVIAAVAVREKLKK